MVSLMTALWFAHLEAPDRVSVKPHASPVLHAINYLLGRLDRRYLTTLREYGGLQSYPSRTKDPDPVDYSTGSVGIGATAPIWGALAHRYVAGHFEVPRGGRQIALLGDAELDEGACWEAIADPMVAKLGEVMWVVDLNRQSLDRVVPDIAAGPAGRDVRGGGLALRDGQVRAAAGARTRPLRERIDAMPNEEYQRLLRADAAELRERLEVDVAGLDDGDLLATFRDLGGHDLGALVDAYRQADAEPDRPTVVFAYTIKGWSLPTEGHPANHSALLNDEQYAQLARARSAPTPRTRGRRSRDDSPEAALCAATGRRLDRPAPKFVADPPAVPDDLGREHKGAESTQQAFGRFFVDLVREAPEVAERVVTVSPDVGTSTNLGGWINKAGIWSPGERIDWFADDTDTLVRWRESDHGRHIELGHRRGQPRRAARRARRDVVARRPAAAAGRHDLRPVRLARAGAVVVRHLRGRAVDPRRHAERRHARARGRRAPVGHHAVDRDRAAGLRGVGARLRAGPRVDAAARAVAARPRGRHARPTSGSRRGRSTRACTRARARRCSRAATGCAPPSDAGVAIVGDGRARARGDRGRRRARRRGGRRRRGRLRHQRRPAVPLLPGARRARRGRPGDDRPAVRRAASRSSRCSTATRTRSRSSRARPARRSPASACRASASRATSPSSTSTTRSTPSRSSAPRSTCSTRDVTDVAVVGGGIVGLATARALALRGRRVLVLEREDADRRAPDLAQQRRHPPGHLLRARAR